MEIKVSWGSNDDVDVLTDSVLNTFTSLETASMAVVYFNCRHDAEHLRTALAERLPCPFMLASSSNGVLASTPEGATARADLAIMLLYDKAGDYGCASLPISEDTPGQDARLALQHALRDSGAQYEAPSLLYCIFPSGKEEILLKGIAEEVGEKIPVFGGTMADNDVSGHWYTGAHQGGSDHHMTVAAMFPGAPVGVSYSSGYRPGPHICKVTKATGRIIETLDNEPAAQVYNRLTGGQIETALSGGPILSLTTLHPFGHKISHSGGISEYLLSHPDAVTEHQGLSVFSDVEQGTDLIVMEGSEESLIARAEKVIENAISLLPQDTPPAGVLLVYCAGCMFTIENQLARMLDTLSTQFTNIPILGIYTFGEQGHFLDGHNRHGNLMISAVAFGK